MNLQQKSSTPFAPSHNFFQLHLNVCVCVDKFYNQIKPLWEPSIFLTNLHHKTLQ